MLEGLGSREFAAIFLALAVGALLLAAGFRTQDLLLAGLTVGLYGLHLVSVRVIRDEQGRQATLLRQVAAALDDLAGGAVNEEGSMRQADAGDAESRARDEPAEAGRARETGDGGGTSVAGGDSKVSRDLRIGTVAVVEGLLEPKEVSRVMSVQERKPDKPFGEIAVQMGLLRPDQAEELLEVKETGLFSKRKLSRARTKLRSFLGREGG